MAKKRRTTIQTMKTDEVSFLLHNRIEKSADYLRRGRSYAKLNDADLLSNWKAALKDMSEQPLDEAVRQRHTDLDAELDLRGLPQPYADEDAKAALNAFVAEADRLLEELNSDPDEYTRVNREMQEDIDTFKAQRDRKN